jgi:hypothetical protein
MLASLVSSTASAAPPAATIAPLRYVKSSLPCRERRKGSGEERWGGGEGGKWGFGGGGGGERANQGLAGDNGEKGKDQGEKRKDERGERLHNGNVQRILEHIDLCRHRHILAIHLSNAVAHEHQCVKWLHNGNIQQEMLHKRFHLRIH